MHSTLNWEIKKGVTIVVCCYNSALRLPQTIKHLALQDISMIPCELIIVNNASTDNSKQVAEQEWNKCKAPFEMKIVDEDKPGLSFAREKGIQEAQYEYIIFCDDDNWLASNYIEVAYDIMSNNPEIGLLAGRNIAVSDVELPYWFSTYQVYYAVGVLGLSSGDVSNRGEIWGAGMVFRKTEYLRLRWAGFKSMLSDRKGNILTGGGDSEICKWYLITGKKLWYDDRLYLWHYMETNRLQPEYLNQLKQMSAHPHLILQRYESILNWVNNPPHVKSKLASLIKHILKLTFLPKGTLFYLQSLIYLEMLNFLPFALFDEDTKRIKQCIRKYNNIK